MKAQPLILFLIFLVASSRNNEKIYHLTGFLENAPDTTTLFLADWKKGILIDSIQIIDGNFEYEFQLTLCKHKSEVLQKTSTAHS